MLCLNGKAIVILLMPNYYILKWPLLKKIQGKGFPLIYFQQPIYYFFYVQSSNLLTCNTLLSRVFKILYFGKIILILVKPFRQSIGLYIIIFLSIIITSLAYTSGTKWLGRVKDLFRNTTLFGLSF